MDMEELAFASQLYLLTDNDQIQEEGIYEEQYLAYWMNERDPQRYKGLCTLYVIRGYYVPGILRDIEENQPERLAFSHFFDGEHEMQHEDGRLEYFPMTIQLWYIKE